MFAIQRWLSAGLMLLILLMLDTGVGFGQRRIMRRPPPPSVEPQQSQPQPQEPPGRFPWERILGDVIEGQMQGGRRPLPERIPTRPPGYVPPNYVRPDYLPSRPAIPENVIVPSTVTPEPNQVVPLIPPQPSPLEGRVWDVSTREAYCYSASLGQQVNATLDEVLSRLGKGTANRGEIEGLVEQVHQMLAANADWRDLEPILRALVDDHRSAFSRSDLERVQQATRQLIVRDAFRLIVESGPRGRGGPFGFEAIPVGLIWIVHDPTLLIGTGLFVSEQVFVCGGEGELYVSRGTVAAALELPVGVGPPVPDIDAEKAHSLRDSIVIHHKKNAATPVNYVLDRRQPFTIQPGHTQNLPADRKWIIEFDRGAGGGTARYSLSKGCYEFRLVDNRWGIVKLKFNVTIDNRAGTQDFVYLMNNEVVTVPAGETQSHEGNDPIVIEFDRGAGPEAPARKNLNKNGTYKVAVDTDNNHLDLFREEQSS